MEKQSFLDDESYFLDVLFGLVGCYGCRRIHSLVNIFPFYMMRSLPLKKLHIYVLISLFLFAGFQLFRYLDISIPVFITSYLNDFLVIPIVATLCLWVIWLIRKNKTIRLNVVHILSLVVLYSIYFEYYLPKYVDRYTADWGDVVCYFLGGCVFYIFQKWEN